MNGYHPPKDNSCSRLGAEQLQLSLVTGSMAQWKMQRSISLTSCWNLNEPINSIRSVLFEFDKCVTTDIG